MRPADVGLHAAVVTLVAPQELPALTVEAPKEQRKPARPKKAATRTAQAADAPATSRVAGAGGADPNAESGAPCKINTSSSSELVTRAEAAGFEALVITVEAPAVGGPLGVGHALGTLRDAFAIPVALAGAA